MHLALLAMLMASADDIGRVLLMRRDMAANGVPTAVALVVGAAIAILELFGAVRASQQWW